MSHWGGGLLAAALFCIPAAAQDFLVQGVCEVPALLPFEVGCHPRPATAGTTPGATLPWRKYDLEAVLATDAVAATRRGAPVVRHSFDFGDAGRTFGRLDATPPLVGDGGNLIARRGADTVILMTQDGGNGVQWFQGPGCEDEPEAGLGGWLLFDDEAGPEWRARLVVLRITRGPALCPLRYVPAYTRWRRLPVEYPWFDGDAPQPPFRAESIISEHYDGRGIERARHLERFWFGRDLGMLRWERWERAGPATDPRRCPAITGAEPPGAGWVLADCRLWTRFRRGEQPIPPWPAAD